MVDLYLKAQSKEQMIDALVLAGIVTVSDNNEILARDGASIDIIGPFSKIVDDVRIDYPDFHVNLRLSYIEEEDLEILTQYSIVPPETPHRIWG